MTENFSNSSGSNCRNEYDLGLRHPLIESPSSEMSYALKRAVRYMEMKYDLAAVRVDFPLAHQVRLWFQLVKPGELVRHRI